MVIIFNSWSIEDDGQFPINSNSAVTDEHYLGKSNLVQKTFRFFFLLSIKYKILNLVKWSFLGGRRVISTMVPLAIYHDIFLRDGQIVHDFMTQLRGASTLLWRYSYVES